MSLSMLCIYTGTLFAAVLHARQIGAIKSLSSAYGIWPGIHGWNERCGAMNGKLFKLLAMATSLNSFA